MAFGNGPRIVTDGLVLALDASDRNSLPSAPIVNLVRNPTFSGSNDSQSTTVTSNWTFSGDSGPNGFRFYTGSVAGVTPLFPGEGMIATLGPNTGSNRRIYYQGGSQANTTYTLSFYYYMTGSLLAGDAVLINEYSGSTNVKSVYYPLTSASLNTWVRNVTTFTTGTGSTGITNWGPVITSTATTGLFIQRLQVEKSPYANDFVTGSRSLTWNNLSGNNNGTLASASAASTIPKFNLPNENVLNLDGTGSFVALNQSIPLTSSFSLRYIFKSNVTASSTRYFNMSQTSAGTTQNSMYLEWNNRFITWNNSGSLAGYCFLFPLSPAFSLQQVFNDFCFVVDGSGIATIYNNGVACTPTGSVTGSFSIDNIGRAQASYVSSSIASVYYYNRPLSAAEVLQNYNALKSRFGL